jgi:hypothetical protein
LLKSGAPPRAQVHRALEASALCARVHRPPSHLGLNRIITHNRMFFSIRPAGRAGLFRLWNLHRARRLFFRVACYATRAACTVGRSGFPGVTGRARQLVGDPCNRSGHPAERRCPNRPSRELFRRKPGLRARRDRRGTAFAGVPRGATCERFAWELGRAILCLYEERHRC